MSNPGYASNIRFPLRPDSPGAIPLTTVPQIVCDPPGTGDTRNILAGIS